MWGGMFWLRVVTSLSPPPTHPPGSDGFQVDQTEKSRSGNQSVQEETPEEWQPGGEREKWRQRLLVYLLGAQVRQAPGDAAQKPPQPVRRAGGVDPGDPEASPGAEDGAGGRSAQTAEEGKGPTLFWCLDPSDCDLGARDVV